MGVLETMRQRILLRKVSSRPVDVGLIRNLGLLPIEEAGLHARIKQAQASNRRALRRYRASPLSENMYLILAQSGVFHRFSPQLGWSRLIDGEISLHSGRAPCRESECKYG